MKKVAVIGATGDVGQGIVTELLTAGYSVVAVGRNEEKLNKLAQKFPEAALQTQTGSLTDRAAGERLATVLSADGKPDVIITSINGQQTTAQVSDLQPDVLERILRDNLSTHLIAAQTLLPVVAEGGMYIGIGGGMADLIFSGYAAISMAQSAQRTLYRYLAKEMEGKPVSIKELMLYSMIDGESKRGHAEPHWITDQEVGRHVVAVLADPGSFEGPILALKSRKQVGLPERKPA